MSLIELTKALKEEELLLKKGGGEKGAERQRRHGRLTVRSRLKLLLDSEEDFFELGIFAGYKMYPEWGEINAAGVVTGIGKVSGRDCMIIANDATVKAGAFFPQSVKKVIRAQNIAFSCRLPTLYLVDSSGVFLPLQDEIFPDEDDFGRIFRNNALFSSAGIPQYAAIMGNCIAGGGYLPVLCDQVLMTEGSGLYLAGPALVKAAIGHDVETEELGGVQMHSEVSGTVDYREKDDPSCLTRLRRLVAALPENTESLTYLPPKVKSEKLYEIVSESGRVPYDVRDVLDCLVDADSMDEYKEGYGKTLVTVFARIGRNPVGIVATQRKSQKTAAGELELGGVLYAECADKAARFVMNCNQMKIPLLFIQDVMGFMVGPQAEQSGIIRSGAKLVNAISNSIVPKITLIIGNSFGAGNYALCGKAYDPTFVVAWPNAKYAVMGAEQAAQTLLKIKEKQWSSEEAERKKAEVEESYRKSMDIRYGAARGWVDAIIDPKETRKILVSLVAQVKRSPLEKSFKTGVFQV